MTDRAIHFVNEVAERVSKVHPDKQIEMYAYGSTTLPPTRFKVHPNVLIKVCYWSNSPARYSLADPTVDQNGVTCKRLDGWADAGARHFGLYDYGSYLNIDCPIFWFFPIVDSLKVFHEKWGFRHYLGETDNTFGPSMMAYNIRARALWNRHINYRDEIEAICRNFYGPAAQDMFDYNMLMHDALLQWEPPDGTSVWIGQNRQYDLSIMGKAQELLDRAAARADGDGALEGRVGVAQFGHSLLTLYVAQKAEPQTRLTITAAKAAHERIMSLWGKNGNLVLHGTRQALVDFQPEP